MVGHVDNSSFVLNWLEGVSVFTNLTWDQPRSQLPILNFEKSRYTFFLIIWLPLLIGSSTNEESHGLRQCRVLKETMTEGAGLLAMPQVPDTL